MGLEPDMGPIYGAGGNLWGRSQSMGPGPAMGPIYGAENVYGAGLWGWSQSMGLGQSMRPIYGARTHYGANLWGQDPLWGQSMGLEPTMGPIYGAGTCYGADLWGWGRCVGPECPIGVPFHPPPPPISAPRILCCYLGLLHLRCPTAVVGRGGGGGNFRPPHGAPQRRPIDGNRGGALGGAAP